MELPRKWPGRVKVRQALTLMRVVGYWNMDIQAYAALTKRFQKVRYPWFREVFYWLVHHKHPDWTRIGR